MPHGRFGSIEFDMHSKELSATIKAKLEQVELVCNQFPDSRYKALVMTALEEAGMWSNKAVGEWQQLHRPKK